MSSRRPPPRSAKGEFSSGAVYSGRILPLRAARDFQGHHVELGAEPGDLVRHALWNQQEVALGHLVHGAAFDATLDGVTLLRFDDSAAGGDFTAAVDDRPQFAFVGVRR